MLPVHRPALLSFDVFGTLISVRESTYPAFERILAGTQGPAVSVQEFWEAWEEENIAAYSRPYLPYKEICRESLRHTFERFGLRGDPASIGHYFDSFPRQRLYDDVLPTLEELGKNHKLAVVSNIDDDLLAATPLSRDFDLVCTAHKAKGYKPDGTLFRYLIEQAGVGKERILHSGQSQFTDMVGAKPLGLAVVWINRRGGALHPSVPKPDLILPDIKSLLPRLEADAAG
ncbi:MAG: haloacid dehalogenase [Rubritepida sp.]|nr:haloacid dehalogenase [Rubritepida sp.]